MLPTVWPERKIPVYDIPPSDTSKKLADFLRLLFLVFIIGSLFFFTIDMFTTKYTLKVLSTFVQSVDKLNTPLVILTIVVTTTATVIIACPTALLGLSGGFLLSSKLGFYDGVTVATFVNLFGSCLGSMICFRLGRDAFRSFVSDIARSYETFYGIEKALERNGFEINVLLRLSPLIPSVILNYGIPSLGAKFDDFMYGAIIGTIPYSFILSFIGAMLDNLDSIETFFTTAPLYLVVLTTSVGLLFLIWGSWKVYKFSTEAIEEAIKEAATANPAVSGSTRGAGSHEHGKHETDRLIDGGSWDPI